MLAPSGRVRMYASQNDSTGPAPTFQATRTARIRPSGNITDWPGDQPVSSMVQSPTAVPRAKVTSTVSQYQLSRERVTIVWIDKVRSRAYQIENTAARRTPNTVVLIHSGTLWPSVRLSVRRVPTTLMSTTDSQ